MYFSDIFYGIEPVNVSLTVLSGHSNNFKVIKIDEGSGYDGDFYGSLTIAGASGIQTFNLRERKVIQYDRTPNLNEDSVEDFS